MNRLTLLLSCLPMLALSSGCVFNLSPVGGTPASGDATSSSASSNQSASSGTAPGSATDSNSASASGSTETSTGTEPSFITCNPGRNDQCLAGQKCSTYLSDLSKKQTDGTRCTPITGSAKLGEACTRNRDLGTDDCGPMLFCDAGCSACEGPGVCIAYCDKDNKEPAQDCAARGVENAHCFPFNDGAIPICKPVCDPLKQDCKDGQACHATMDNFLCTSFRPEPGSEGKYGQPCDRVQSCAPGLTCRKAAEVEACKDQAEGNCCVNLCDLSKGDAECTNALESCQPIFEEAVRGIKNVGVCVIPQVEDTGTQSGASTGSL